MGEFLETLYDVLFHPAAALRNIAMEKKVGQSLGAFLISIFVPAWAVYFGLQNADFPTISAIVIFIQVIGSTILWLVGAGFFGLLAELFGGQGTAIGLLAGMGFANFPRVFVVPLIVLSTLLPGSLQSLVLVLFGSILVFWIITLHVIAIREAYVLSTLKAVAVVITPVAVMVVCGIIVAVSLGTMLLQWMPRL